MKYIFLMIFPVISYAISFAEIKERLRDKLSPYLSESLIIDIFGKKEVVQKKEYKVPEIPKVNKTATDINTLKNNYFDNKKTKYDALSDKEKRKYRIAFLQELYFVALRENISNEQLITYLSRLEQGAKREGIYRSFVLGREYRELEDLPTVISEKLLNFTLSFSKRFLNKNYSRSSIANMNKFSIKRILTENALEVLDVLSKKPEDVYAWYAVFSQEVSEYDFWKNRNRKKVSGKFHYNWAKGASFQHIKSETIIKLHKIANSLR